MASELKPQNPRQVPRFGGLPTFSRLPYKPDFKNQELDVAILGIPSDAGTTFRPGARFGPRGLREASVLCRNYHPVLDVDIYDTLRIADIGDVATDPISLQKTFDSIQEKIRWVLKRGAKPVSLGGDHSQLLPILRAMSEKHRPLTLIHFDAHTDTGDEAWGEKYHHGTPVRRAIEEKLVDPKRIFQIGIRGPQGARGQEDYGREKGIHVLTAEGYDDAKTRDRFFAKLKQVAGKNPCYLTFDIDGVDPAYAPGTGTPVVGGLTSREALAAVRKLAGLRLVGADIVEVSPPYDQSDITCLLGAALVFEFLSLMAVKK